MADNKQVKSVGEFWVASQLAKRGWAAALTRDGLERTDILAVRTEGTRSQVEIQVKTARGSGDKVSWFLGLKAQLPPEHEHEWFVLVITDKDLDVQERAFIVPRLHLSAMAWMRHKEWLTEEGIPVGRRNVGVEHSRVQALYFSKYENRWDLLGTPASEVPVLFESKYRQLAQNPLVGLPDRHPWKDSIPEW